jgi:hypothetical protein
MVWGIARWPLAPIMVTVMIALVAGSREQRVRASR